MNIHLVCYNLPADLSASRNREVNEISQITKTLMFELARKFTQ